ncbi:MULTISPECIES: hypothetical protein [unclassified Agarivorans]|uniref:hypothetical protein n=1 Tax=unclassified Agarivorans TaxID=2636026 RepID=UPI003D7DAF7E
MLKRLGWKLKQAFTSVMVEQQRVWIISRHDSLSQQDIYPLGEAELKQRSWQQRGFDAVHQSQIEQLRPGAILQVFCQQHSISITRVK